MIHIWILTNSFPYGSGEQFLETEIGFWASLSEIKVTLIPSQAAGASRTVPPTISVDLCLTTKLSKATKLSSLVAAIHSSLFIKELLWLRKNRILSAQNAYAAWRTAASVIFQYKILCVKQKRTKGRAIIGYSYWFETSSYAIGLLRRRGLAARAVTRAHGYDVYEERRRGHYMPLKRQFVADLDTIFAVSQSGLSYLRTRYSIAEHRLRLGRLGVNLPDNTNLTQPSGPGRLEIVSVSFCVAVKRIDRIIDALEVAAERVGKDVTIRWVHIGDGELRNQLLERAVQVLGKHRNVSFEFLGALSNDQVLMHLKTNNIDVFINSSASEGVPVSIMEALSYGIPVIAPSVGGVPEIVSNETGKLLSHSPTHKEIAEAILLFEHFKCKRTRESAREKASVFYNASKNYSAFVNDVTQGL